jgi:hypothetical protein
MLDIKEHIGNIELLKLSKTAFLCSRQVPASVVLKCYDWAIEQREKGNCVISGFHSPIEKDVMRYLIKGSQPIILALARGIKKILEPEFEKPVKEGRMLIMTAFENSVTRVTQKTCNTRNIMMMELADNIIIGYTHPEGELEKLVTSIEQNKTIARIHK